MVFNVVCCMHRGMEGYDPLLRLPSFSGSISHERINFSVGPSRLRNFHQKDPSSLKAERETRCVLATIPHPLDLAFCILILTSSSRHDIGCTDDKNDLKANSEHSIKRKGSVYDKRGLICLKNDHERRNATLYLDFVEISRILISYVCHLHSSFSMALKAKETV